MSETVQSPPRPALAHAFWWALFAQGGLIAALLLPVHVLVQGILGPLRLVPVVSGGYRTYALALESPLFKLYLLLIMGATFFHAAHRFRYMLIHLGVRSWQRQFAYACYGLAALGSVVALAVLFNVP